MVTKLPIRLSADLRLPLDAVTETLAVMGVRGSGKSSTAKVLVEQLTNAGMQCVILDPTGVWWGLKSSVDGKSAGLPFTVLGGQNGDLPLNAAAGEVIADLVVETDTPLVLDLSLMRKGEQRRFVLAFAETLYHRNRDPLMLVVDEADLFAPQRPMKGEERLLGAIEDIARRGRVKGLGAAFISQRPASVAKDVLSQCSTLVACRLIGSHDRAAIDAWVEAHGTREQRNELMSTIAGLATGEAWFWSPSWLDLFLRVQVDRSATFDSMVTPKAGTKRVLPKVLSKVDVDALRDKLASFVAEAEANDPRLLKQRIVVLERELAKRPTATKPATPATVEKIVHVEVPVADPAAVATAVATTKDVAVSAVEALRAGLAAAVDRALDDIRAAVADTAVAPPPATSPAASGHPRPRPLARTAAPDTPPKPAPSPRPTPPAAAQGEVQLKAGARRILETLARHHPMRTTKAQAGTLTGFKVSGGTWSTYVGTMRRAGYLDIDPAGLFYVTDAGLAVAGVDTAVPMSTEEVLDRWRQALKKGAREMLDILVDAYPNTVTRAELADQLSMAVLGGTFSTYLGTIKRNGLADVDGQNVRASDSLFLSGR